MSTFSGFGFLTDRDECEHKTTSDRGITDENRSQVDATARGVHQSYPTVICMHAYVHFICTVAGTATAAN